MSLLDWFFGSSCGKGCGCCKTPEQWKTERESATPQAAIDQSKKPWFTYGQGVMILDNDSIFNGRGGIIRDHNSFRQRGVYYVGMSLRHYEYGLYSHQYLVELSDKRQIWVEQEKLQNYKKPAKKE